MFSHVFPQMMLESEGQIIAFRQTEGLVKRGQRP